MEERDGEQAILGYAVFALTVRLEALITRADPIAPGVPDVRVVRRPLERKMTRVETGQNRIDTHVSDLEDDPERTELKKSYLITNET